VADCESTYSNILCGTPQSQSFVQVSQPVSGVLQTSGNGKNATVTFTPGDFFSQGDDIGLRITVVDDETGLPVSGATVDFDVTGPETVSLISAPSDANGVAEAIWSTQGPNKKGQGGTATGSYQAAVSDVLAAGYAWNGVPQQVTFTIQ
jgi:hypothetical protein